MSKLLKVGAQKLPTMLGAGIIGVSLAGLAAAAMGLSLPLAAELASAAVGIVVGSRYA